MSNIGIKSFDTIFGRPKAFTDMQIKAYSAGGEDDKLQATQKTQGKA